MPASEFRSSCFNTVYGVKRKASVEDVMEVWSSDAKCEEGVKRLCKWTSQPHQLGLRLPDDHQPRDVFTQEALFNNNNNNSVPMTVQVPLAHDSTLTEEMNHNSPTVQDQQQLYEEHQLKNPVLAEVLSQQPPRVPSPWPSQQPFQPAHMTDHIMDLNEGTYSADTSEMEVACSAMESDCTPNPAQYKDTQQQHSPNTEFCKNFCGGGEVSPNSGRVRCYCKPSWEGMLDMKPYISDVY